MTTLLKDLILLEAEYMELAYLITIPKLMELPMEDLESPIFTKVH